MLTNDSIDVFMLQTLQNKQQRYLEAMKKGADVVDVSDIDTQALKTAIITKPETRAEIEIQIKRKKLEKQQERIKADLSFGLRKYEKYIEAKEIEERHKKTYESYYSSADENNWWMKKALAQWEEAKKNTQSVIDTMKRRGVDIEALQFKIKQAEDKILLLEEALKNLSFKKEELTQRYTAEKERALKDHHPMDFVKERAEENISFF